MSACTNNSSNFTISTLTNKQKDDSLIVMSSIGLVSLISCVPVIVLVFCLKKHQYFVYRLALYQVISSMLISVHDVLVITLLSNIEHLNHTFHHVMCLITGFLFSFFLWMKLIFTTLLTFHLFSMAVCYKDFKSLEKGFVLISFFLPLILALVPFTTNTYGPARSWCWIEDRNGNCSSLSNMNGIIEQYTLWYGPCYVFLGICIVAAVIVVIVMCFRARCSASNKEDDLLLQSTRIQNKKALIEILPLLAYPWIFFSLNFLAVVHRIHNVLTKSPNYGLLMTHAVVNASWGLSSSIALFLHMMISVLYLRKTRVGFNPIDTVHRTSATEGTESRHNAIHERTFYTDLTYYVAPVEGETDEESQETDNDSQ